MLILLVLEVASTQSASAVSKDSIVVSIIRKNARDTPTTRRITARIGAHDHFPGVALRPL
jgi:hypothetical protein